MLPRVEWSRLFRRFRLTLLPVQIWGIGAGCVVAQELPPRQFQHAPGCVISTFYAPIGDIDKLCRAFGAQAATARGRIWSCTAGCTQIKADPCDWLWSVDPMDQYAQLSCHENAHVNGWPAEHGSGADVSEARERAPRQRVPTAGQVLPARQAVGANAQIR
jgi:hypothetical protein